MKKQDFNNLKIKPDKELVIELHKLRKELVSKNADLALRKAKNTHETNSLRKDIARVLTLLKQKEMTSSVEELKNKSMNKKEVEIEDSAK